METMFSRLRSGETVHARVKATRSLITITPIKEFGLAWFRISGGGKKIVTRFSCQDLEHWTTAELEEIISQKGHEDNA